MLHVYIKRTFVHFSYLFATSIYRVHIISLVNCNSRFSAKTFLYLLHVSRANALFQFSKYKRTYFVVSLREVAMNGRGM